MVTYFLFIIVYSIVHASILSFQDLNSFEEAKIPSLSPYIVKQNQLLLQRAQKVVPTYRLSGR